MSTKDTTLIPREARTDEAICALSRDNVGDGEFWLVLSDTEVTIGREANGRREAASVEISRRAFDAFVDWYERGIIPPRDARSHRPASPPTGDER